MKLIQTYQPLLNKKNFLIILFSLLQIFIFNKYSYSKNIFPIIVINNQLITNVDLYNEVKFLKIEYQNSNEQYLKNIAVKNLIELVIKKEELKKKDISINKKLINNEVSLNYKRFLNNKNIEPENLEFVKKKIFEKVDLNLKWSELIKKIYISQIVLNTQEINDIVKKNKLNSTEKQNLILKEKIKKLEKFSKSHFINIKKNYKIKFL